MKKSIANRDIPCTEITCLYMKCYKLTVIIYILHTCFINETS